MKHVLFNKALRLLLLTNGIILLAGAMLGPIYALFVEGIGGDLLDASLTGGIFALAAGLTTLYSGKLCDKGKHPKFIISFGYFCMAVGFFGYNFVDSIYALFFIQIIIGFGEAIYSPAFDSLYSKNLAKTMRGREWGTWEAMNYFSIAIGAAIGGFIVTYLGFRSLFVLMGLISLFSSLFLFFAPKKSL